ncbi:MAG: hypothetical protein ACFFFG_18520 [Candidatus Thorarchaeota archaeon]
MLKFASEPLMREERPIFAESFFQIRPRRIFQALFFYYHDPAQNYFYLKETGALKGEIEVIRQNLQAFIDADALWVNDRKTRMLISQIQLEFRKNRRIFPYLNFKIQSEPYILQDGKINKIHLYAKPEDLAYPAISCWQTTIGLINSVISRSFHQLSLDKTRVTFYMSKGDIVGGDEQIFIDLT